MYLLKKKDMAKKNKEFQLTISGWNYETCHDVDKVSLITKEELEILTPLFIEIKNCTDSYNWSASDSLYQNKYGGWMAHLNALWKKYNMKNIDLEKLVLRLFPLRGYVDKITKIEIAEIKLKEKFL